MFSSDIAVQQRQHCAALAAQFQRQCCAAATAGYSSATCYSDSTHKHTHTNTMATKMEVMTAAAGGSAGTSTSAPAHASMYAVINISDSDDLQILLDVGPPATAIETCRNHKQEQKLYLSRAF